MIKEMLLVAHILLLGDVTVNRETAYIMQDIRAVTQEPIVITSAVRTPRRQAELMVYSYRSGNNLIYLYGNKVRKYLSLIRQGDIDALEIEFTHDNSISAHLTGRAVDVRSRSLSKKAKEALFSLEDGGRYDVIEEYNPPHIHIELNAGS